MHLSRYICHEMNDEDALCSRGHERSYEICTTLRMRISVEFYMRRVYVAHGLYTSMLQSKVAQHNDYGLSTSFMVSPNLVYKPHDMRIGLLFPADIQVYCVSARA